MKAFQRQINTKVVLRHFWSKNFFRPIPRNPKQNFANTVPYFYFKEVKEQLLKGKIKIVNVNTFFRPPKWAKCL